MHDLNIDLINVNAIFITHSHTDHIKGLEVLFKNNNHIDVYMASEVAKSIGFDEYIDVDFNDDITIGGTDIKLMPTSHDAIKSFGLIFSCEDKKFTHVTDTGYLSSGNIDLMKKSSGYLIESNYDDEMIMSNTRYPFMTKKRIMSNQGHLSNKQCDMYLNDLICDSTNYILYAHLSENNNLPSIVRKFADKIDVYTNVLPANTTEVINYVW